MRGNKKSLSFSVLFLILLISVVGFVSAAEIGLCQKDTTTWECIGEGPIGTVEYYTDNSGLHMTVELIGLSAETSHQLTIQGREETDGNEEIGSACDNPDGTASGWECAIECGTSSGEGYWNFDMDAVTDGEGYFIGNYDIASLPEGYYGAGLGFIVKIEADPSCTWSDYTPVLMETQGLEFTIEYDEYPTCSVDYIEHETSDNIYSFETSIYVNEMGDFFVNGMANDEDSDIDNLQYNRDSPNTEHSWTDSDPVDGAFNSMEEAWRSDPNDESYIEGWHEICCRSIDDADNVQEDVTCVEFCIDTEEPSQVTGIAHSNPSECVSNYVNVAPEFSWDSSTDEGCADIDYYEIYLFLSDGTFVDSYETGDNSFSVPVEELVNGQDYYIMVRAIDNADNEGAWSINSEHVYYDNEDPEVTITGDAWDEWYNDDFYVFETDTDNLGLWKCEMAISNDGSAPTEYTEVDCNSELGDLVDVSLVCPEDGLNNCWVRKRATDKACNMDMEGHEWDLDREAPVTTKTVGEDSYFLDEFFSWLGFEGIVHYFVKPNTKLTLTCFDEGIGCEDTLYKYRYYDGVEWTAWSDLLSYNDAEDIYLEDGDGIYELEYYSVDGLSNAEIIHTETDKVDTEAPVTTKTYEGDEFWGWRFIDEFNLNVWIRYISGDTQIKLTAEDSEVGVDETYFQILVPGGEDDVEWYGQEEDSWYETSEDCLLENDEEDCILTNWGINYEGIYEEPITVEESEHKICYYSEDLLGNVEDTQCQVFSVDDQAPEIIIHNPTIEEREIERCAQSIVVEAFDDKSGVSRVWAELWTNPEVGESKKVKETELRKSIYGTWEALMNKELPAGEYTLNIYAEDNLGNVNDWTYLEETLIETVFVEYISPAVCNIDPEEGGDCDFTMHVCMRGENSLQFWMNKLGDLVTPDMMGATISNGESAFVGLKHEGFQSEAEVLQLGCEEINEQTQFDLHLGLDAEEVSLIGPGVHDLEYWIESSSQECEPEEPECTPTDEVCDGYDNDCDELIDEELECSID